MQHKNARENGKAATCRKMQDLCDKARQIQRARFLVGSNNVQLDFDVDLSTMASMSAKPKSAPVPKERRILGFSLAPSLAADVKAEAGRRGISLRKLFEELWELYKKQPPKKS
jgi:hypothetical protein